MNKSFVLLGTFFVSLLLLSVSFAAASASPRLISTPQQPLWIADGSTVYTVNIYANNIPLDGTSTRGLEVQYMLPQADGYSFNLVGFSWPSENDFFQGYHVMNFGHDAGTHWISKTVSSPGPSNRDALFATLKFTVSPTSSVSGTQSTSVAFDANEGLNYFVVPGGQAIFAETTAMPITVMAPQTCNKVALRAARGAAVADVRTACASVQSTHLDA